MVNIYIFKLENNKYYVGKSNDQEMRTLAQIINSDNIWIKKNKPIAIEEIINNVCPFDEDRYTFQYMDKYGIDNVRGGSYVTEELDSLQRFNIKKSIWDLKDCCSNCGRKGHFKKKCNYSVDVYGDEIKICDYDSPMEEESYGETFECKYCGIEFETYPAAVYHENIYCDYKYDYELKYKCRRCGRKGHNCDECCETNHINGIELNSESDMDYEYDSESD
jgi:cellular nucleic acid-binding protein